MSILLSKESRVLVQGLTGREGSFHAEQMKAYGTNLVAGVSPGKGGSTQLGIPIFDTVVDARRETGADVSGIFVPAPFAADAIMEAAAAGIGLIVCITEGIPLYDMVRARAFVMDAGVKLIGPNCPGLVTAGQAKVGIIPNHINREGSVGIVSRSGTLTYEVIQGLSQAGVGQTTSVGIGGDPILGLSFSEVLRLFKNDPVTRAVVMIGEIGGSDEEAAADEVIGPGFGKPVIGFISGRTAPPGKRMGHAGAIISGNTGTAASKLKALTQAGAQVCDTIEEVVAAAGAAVGQRSGAVPR
jgi:succinyl-CoA synthetase alpha subunit